jgi:hypothetical protein
MDMEMDLNTAMDIDTARDMDKDMNTDMSTETDKGRAQLKLNLSPFLAACQLLK